MNFQFEYIYTYKGAVIFAVLMAAVYVAMVLIPGKMKNERAAGILSRYTQPVYVAGVLTLVLSILAGDLGHYEGSMFIYSLSLCILGCGIILMFFYSQNINVLVSMQLSAVGLFIAVWYMCAVRSGLTIKENRSLIVTGLVVSLANAVMWCVKTASAMRDSGYRLDTRMLIRKYVWLLPVWGVASVVTFANINLPYLWDAADYLADFMKKSARWEFTTGLLLKNLSLAGHHSAGYTVLIQPGVWLFGDTIKGVHLATLGILLFTMFCLWELLSREYPNMNSPERMTVTMMFLLMPSVLAMSFGFNLDYGMLCLMVWVLYAWSCDLLVFKILFGTMLCFTKEPAIVLYAGMALGWYLVKYRTKYSAEHKEGKRARIQSLFNCMNLSEWVVLALPLIIWGAIFAMGINWKSLVARNGMRAVAGVGSVLISGGGWSNGGNMLWAGTSPELEGRINCFGYSPRYILNQIEHVFLINFMWVITALVIILGAVYLIRNHKEKITINTKMVTISLSGMVLFVAFLTIYITHPHYRYVAPAGILLMIVFVSVVNAVIGSSKARICIYAAICILMGAESVATVDPVTANMGNRVSTGKSYVVNYNYNEEAATTKRVLDYTIYNLQSYEYGELLSRMFEAIYNDGGWSDNSIVLVPVTEDGLFYCKLGGTAAVDNHGLYYSPEVSRFSAVRLAGYYEYPIGELDMNTRDVAMHHTEAENIDGFENIYYLDVPFADDIDVDSFLDLAGLSVDKRIMIDSANGWSGELVKASRK